MGTVIKITHMCLILQFTEGGIWAVSATSWAAWCCSSLGDLSFLTWETEKSHFVVPVCGLFFWARRKGQEAEEGERRKWSLADREES